MNKLIALAALAGTAAALCDGTTTETLTGGMVVCTLATADTNACVLTCTNGMTATGSITCNSSDVYVNSTPAAACPSTSSTSTTSSVALTDDEFEKAGCKVREADVTKYDGDSAPDAFKAALTAAGSAAATQLQIDMVIAVKLGNQVSEAAYKAAVGDKTLTEAQVTLLKKRYCVGSNFVTAAVALAVAFVLAK